MTLPKPPQLATWLLRHLSSGQHTEPLTGDLIEEFARGRSRAWYWRQVLIAILVSAKRAVAARILDLTRAVAPRILYLTRRVLFRLAAELSAVLTIVTIVDQSRKMHSLGEMWTPIFTETVVFLAALALIAFRLSRPRLGSSRRHTMINHLFAVFAVVALGAGTLTWAGAVRSTCKTETTCVCSKFELTSIAQAKH